jgi:hypothetical protein
MLRQAVALLDTHAGQGGAFWRDYTRELLPQPAQLSLPFCLPPQLLEQLQDADIIQGAQQQQVGNTHWLILPRRNYPTTTLCFVGLD